MSGRADLEGICLMSGLVSGRAENCLEGIYLMSGLVWMKPRDEFYPELVQSLVVLGNVVGCREAARPGSLAAWESAGLMLSKARCWLLGVSSSAWLQDLGSQAVPG